MMQYQGGIGKAVKLLLNQELSYDNTIIIGDNAVGKSEVVRQFVLTKLVSKKYIYYIDAVNRSFNISKINGTLNDLHFSDNITIQRIKDDTFNLADSWAYYGTATECIELIYPKYEEAIQKLLLDYVDDSFQIGFKGAQEVIYANGETGKLSSGYQAVVRLLLELLYIRDVTGESGCLVVIDEIDEYLSPRNSRRLYPFLLEHFKNIRFIFTTHSADFIVGAKNANILILRRDNVEELDADDINDIEDAMAVFNEVFGAYEDVKEGNPYDSQLRLLINNRIAGIWGMEEEACLDSIPENELTKAQKLIYR